MLIMEVVVAVQQLDTDVLEVRHLEEGAHALHKVQWLEVIAPSDRKDFHRAKCLCDVRA